MYATVNPATGETIKTFPTATDAEIEAVLGSAQGEFAAWAGRPVEERAAVVGQVAELFAERAEGLAKIAAVEMGKRVSEGLGELSLVSDIFAYYADNGPSFMADEELSIAGGTAVVQKRPIGPVLGIMPWNYPYYQVARFAAPNLVLGNPVVLKHAPSCPQAAEAIQQVMRDAGVPEGAYVNVFASNDQVSAMLANPRVKGVSLTGSERAGAAVAQEAGRNLKKVVLELGGSDPMVILDSADLDQTVKTAVESRIGNMGQACNAPKRMIVMDDLYDEFVTKLTEQMSDYQAGDPLDEKTSLAPLSSVAAAENVVDQVERAVAQGATLRTGGRRLEGPGAYVEPTVLTEVTPEMDAHHQEIFGPVAIVYRVADEEEAVRLANDTPFGLGSGIFSADLERARAFGEKIDAGMVYLNQAGGSQADLPFGGTKRSGIGRELGPLGFDEFANRRIIRVPAE